MTIEFCKIKCSMLLLLLSVFSTSFLPSTSAMDEMTEMNNAGLIFSAIPKEIKGHCFSYIPKFLDLKRFLCINKELYALAKNTDYWESLVTMPELKRMKIVPDTIPEDPSICARLAFFLQNKVRRLESGLSIYFKEDKEGGGLYITSYLKAEELHTILSNFPEAYLTLLSPQYRWLLWCAHIPLLAIAQESSNYKDLYKLLGFHRCNEEGYMESCVKNLREFAADHTQAGFLYALFYQFTSTNCTFEFYSKNSSNLHNTKIFQFNLDNNVLDIEDEERYFILNCYKKAITENIPSAREELENLRGRHFPLIDTMISQGGFIL